MDKKVGNMARVWDSEELGNRTEKRMYTLHCKSFMSHCTFDEKS